MRLPTESELVGEQQKYEGKPLYEAIVLRARERGMAGATVLKGSLGFGADSRMHSSKILEISEDLPMVIEIVDKPERIAAFLPELDILIKDGLVTLESVQVIAYRAEKKPAKK